MLLWPRLSRSSPTRYLETNPDDLRGLAALLGQANLNTAMIYTRPDIDDLEHRTEHVERGNGEHLSTDLPSQPGRRFNQAYETQSIWG